MIQGNALIPAISVLRQAFRACKKGSWVDEVSFFFHHGRLLLMFGNRHTGGGS